MFLITASVPSVCDKYWNCSVQKWILPQFQTNSLTVPLFARGENTYANISAFKMLDVPALCLLLLTTKLSLNALQVEVCESEHCWSSSKEKDGSSRTDVEESLSNNTHYSLQKLDFEINMLIYIQGCQGLSLSTPHYHSPVSLDLNNEKIVFLSRLII